MKVVEVNCRHALNPCGIDGMDYALNPYIGCEHSCIYCYATFIRRWRGHKEPWGKMVEVKINLLETLKTDVKKKRKGRVCIGSITDPYQPIEMKYRLTRKAIETLREAEFEFEILTKSALIIKDLDVLKDYKKCSVEITLTTLDDSVRKIFEPNASSVGERKEAIAKLCQNGIETILFFGPIIPCFQDRKEAIAQMIEFGESVGVKEILFDRLNYLPQKLPLIKNRLKNFERERKSIEALARDYDRYTENLRNLVREVSKKYSVPTKIIF